MPNSDHEGNMSELKPLMQVRYENELFLHKCPSSAVLAYTEKNPRSKSNFCKCQLAAEDKNS